MDREGAAIIKQLRDENSEETTPKIFNGKKETFQPQRRDRHDIVAEILKTARDGEKKTHIMYDARLSHSQLESYLELLDRNGMIVYEDGVYKTTPKGLLFVKELEAVNFLFRQ